MKNLSVFQIVLLSVFGALAVSGVLIFAIATTGNQANPVGPVVIWGTFDQNAFTSAIQKAADSDARLGQVTYVKKDPATYESEITNELANGQGPDVFLMRQDYVVRDVPKVQPFPAATISQTQFQNVFIDAANSFSAPAGTIGFPIAVDPLVLFWNRDMLSTAGFSKPPVYWEELPGMAQALTKRSNTGSVLKSAIALGEYANVTHAKDILALLILQAGGAITAQNSSDRLESALSSQSNSAAAESALRFYTQFADPSNTVDYTWNRSLPDAQKTFASGDAALYIGYASEANLIARMNPNLNFAVAPIPQIQSKDRALDVAHVYALAISRTGKNQNGATIVATLLSSLPIAQDVSAGLGIPSALRSILAQNAAGTMDLFNKQAIIARTWLDPDPDKTEDVFRGMIEGVTTGALRVPEAVQRADQEMGQIISNSL